MKKEEMVLKEVVREFSKKFNTKEKVIIIMLEKCKELGYNIFESKKVIIEFFTCPKLVHVQRKEK